MSSRPTVLAGLIGAGHGLGHRLLADEAPPVAFDRRALQIAPAQHQEHEDRDKIEIHQPLTAQHPAGDRSEVGRDQPQRDRQIDVQRARPHRPPRALHEIPAAHQHRQRGGKKGDQLEQAGEFEIRGHAQIDRQRETHRVEREGAAQPEPRRQPPPLVIAATPRRPAPQRSRIGRARAETAPTRTGPAPIRGAAGRWPDWPPRACCPGAAQTIFPPATRSRRRKSPPAPGPGVPGHRAPAANRSASNTLGASQEKSCSSNGRLRTGATASPCLRS